MSGSDAPPGLGEWAGFQVFKCGWWIQQRAEEELEPLGIRGRHFMVLAMAEGGGGMSQQQMASYMSLDPTSMVALVDELERLGLCARTRDPQDRRRHVVEVTAAGKRMLRRGRAAIQRVDDEVFGALSDADRRRLGELVGRAMEPYWSAKLRPARVRKLRGA